MYYKKNDIYLNIYQRLLKEAQYSVDQTITSLDTITDATKQIEVIKRNNLILEIFLKIFEIKEDDIKKFYSASKLDAKKESGNKAKDSNKLKGFLETFIKDCKEGTEVQDGKKIIEATRKVKGQIAKMFPTWSVLQWFLINWFDSNNNELHGFIDNILKNPSNFQKINDSNFLLPTSGIISVDKQSPLVQLLNKNPLKEEQKKDLIKSLLKNNLEDSEKSGSWDWLVDGFDSVMGTLFPDEAGKKFSDSIKDYTKNLNLAMGRKKDDPTVIDEFFKELQKNPDKITGAEALKHVMVLSAKGQKPSQELLDKATKEFKKGLTGNLPDDEFEALKNSNIDNESENSFDLEGLNLDDLE